MCHHGSVRRRRENADALGTAVVDVRPIHSFLHRRTASTRRGRRLFAACGPDSERSSAGILTGQPDPGYTCGRRRFDLRSIAAFS
jgi:hypothetical protein